MPMDIPAIYAVLKGGEVRTAPVKFEGTDVSFLSEPVRQTYSAEGTDDRMPVAVADVKGLGRGELDDRLLTSMRFPGNDVWLMTHISDIEDVFDCFMGEVSKVLIPYHTVRNGLVMNEAYEVSENCIPVLFVLGGAAVCRGGRREDLRTAMGDLSKTGFQDIAVLDADSSVRRDEWMALGDRYEGLIPFLRKGGGSAEGMGFKMIIVDL
jgi:hypothetical protein